MITIVDAWDERASDTDLRADGIWESLPKIRLRIATRTCHFLPLNSLNGESEATAKIPKTTGDKWMTHDVITLCSKLFDGLHAAQWLKMFLMAFPFRLRNEGEESDEREILLSGGRAEVRGRRRMAKDGEAKWRNPRNPFILADHWLSAKINRNWTSRERASRRRRRK